MTSADFDNVLKASRKYFLSESPKISAFGSGHINNTFLVEADDHRYIFQRINTLVFTEPEKIIRNIQTVNDYLQHRSYPLERLEIIPSLKGELITFIGDDCFRVYPFLENTHSYDIPPDVDTIHKAGKSFGEFHKALFGLGIHNLETTLPGFFDFNKRQTDFEKALETAEPNRKSHAEAEISEIEKELPLIERMESLLLDCQAHVIHGDPKLNNLLFSDKNEPFCIVDLDTIMAGPLFYDFSDMVRSYSNMTSEDEQDLSKVIPSKVYLNALIDAYLPEIVHSVSENERQSFLTGFSFITFIQALRFLTDYLNKDIYYQTDYENHNLVRARNQLKLFTELENIRPEVEERISSYFPR